MFPVAPLEDNFVVVEDDDRFHVEKIGFRGGKTKKEAATSPFPCGSRR